MTKQPVTIIAEVAQGYEGKPVLGELLIKGAAAAGADAIKFQIVYADDVAVPGYRYYDWYQQLEMPEEAWRQLKDSANRCGLAFYSDLSGERALKVAKQIRPDGVKIHSGNFFNHQLVDEALANFPRVLISTGGIQAEELEGFIRRHHLKPGSDQAVFLFGFQADPTPIESTQLARLPALQARLEGFELGFMDHTDGDGPDPIAVSLMALALGLRFFEKHLTLDRALKLEDYMSALEPARFTHYVQTLRRLDAALGSPSLELTQAEVSYRRKMVKKLIAARDLPAGHVLQEPDLVQKRQEFEGDGFSYDPTKVFGRRLAHPIAAGEALRERDLG